MRPALVKHALGKKRGGKGGGYGVALSESEDGFQAISELHSLYLGFVWKL